MIKAKVSNGNGMGDDAKIIVPTIEGLYDEKSKALTCNISSVKKCRFGHKWINASLHFGKKTKEGNEYSISIECRHDDEFFCSHWGEGYGGIRYCEDCKLIDCIHMWDEEKTYEVQHGKFYSVVSNVAHCRICDKRILRGGYGWNKPDTRAWDIINAEFARMGKEPISAGRYGSGYMCEFPVAVSQILDSKGEQAARDYVVATAINGNCENSFKRVHG